MYFLIPDNFGLFASRYPCSLVAVVVWAFGSLGMRNVRTNCIMFPGHRVLHTNKNNYRIFQNNCLSRWLGFFCKLHYWEWQLWILFLFSIEINHQITGHQDSGTRILGGHAPKLWLPIFWASSSIQSLQKKVLTRQTKYKKTSKKHIISPAFVYNLVNRSESTLLVSSCFHRCTCLCAPPLLLLYPGDLKVLQAAKKNRAIQKDKILLHG